MALGTAAEWLEDGDVKNWMLDKLRTEDAPANLLQCHQDEQWWELFCLWATKNFMDESVDFLNAVDDYRRTRDGNKADALYREFLAPDANRPVNVSDGNVAEVQDLYSQDPPMRSLEMFDKANTEVHGVLDGNYQQRFLGVVRTVRPGLEPPEAPEEDGEAHEIGDPEAVKLTRDHLDVGIIDSFNQQVLKDLTEGDWTNYYQVGDLLLLKVDGKNEPYINWFRDNPEMQTGRIIMNAKGKFMDPGSLTVKGNWEPGDFMAAIARISKKKVRWEPGA